MEQQQSKISAKEKLKKKMVFLLIACLFSALLVVVSFFFFPGYRVEHGDQNFYIPPLFQKTVPESYSRDFLMENTQTSASFFDELVGITFLGNPENIYISLFWWTTFSQFLFFLAIIGIAFSFSKNRLFSLLVPIFFLVGHEGSVCNALPATIWTFSFGTELHARSLALSLATGALALFLLQRKLLSWIVLTAGVLIHFISALPVLFFFSVYTLFFDVWQKKNTRSLWYFLFPVFSIGTIFLFLGSGSASGMDFFTRVDAEWTTFLRERVEWIFSWDHLSSPSVLLTIYLPLFLFLCICETSSCFSRKIKEIFGIFFFSLVFLMGIGLLFFDALHFSLFGQLQLYRVGVFLRILFVIAMLSVCFWEMTGGKRTSLEKILYALAFFFIPFGGTHFLVPLSLLVFFVILFLQVQGTLLHKSYQKILFFSMAILLCGLTIYFSAEVQIQFHNLSSFFKNLLFDPLVSLGLFSLWMQQIFPILLLLLVFLFWRSGKYPKKSIPAFVGISIFLLVTSGFFFQKSYQAFTTSPLQNPTEVELWVRENVANNDLIFATEGAEGEAVNLRNRFGKSIFVTQVEGGQGAFQRAYALEWKHRKQVQGDLVTYWEELKNTYHINFVLAKKEEKIPEGEPVFSDEVYMIYKIK
ncbi:hypothetical protein IPN35_03795 [Candidatus Peregrinibacteria bacterium]|nr:MAG: hypothetical protein IPN35_03795 [Candidatus Peregrinibacteria bacterium]